MWDLQGDYEEGNEQGKVFEICLLDRIRGRVHVIGYYSLVHLLHETVLHNKNLLAHLEKLTKWQSDIVYVNSLFVTIITSLK